MFYCISIYVKLIFQMYISNFPPYCFTLYAMKCVNEILLWLRPYWLRPYWFAGLPPIDCNLRNKCWPINQNSSHLQLWKGSVSVRQSIWFFKFDESCNCSWFISWLCSILWAWSPGWTWWLRLNWMDHWIKFDHWIWSSRSVWSSMVNWLYCSYQFSIKFMMIMILVKKVLSSGGLVV